MSEQSGGAGETPAHVRGFSKERLLSDAELVKGGAEIVAGPNEDDLLELTEDQVEAVRSEMNLDLERRSAEQNEARVEEYDRKVDLLAAAFTQEREGELIPKLVNAFRANLLRQEIDPASISVWEAYRENLRLEANRRTGELISPVAAGIYERSQAGGELDPIDNVWARVIADSRGSLDPENLSMRPRDAADFVTGHGLSELVDSRRLPPEDLSRATDAIRLILSYGEKKFFSFEATKQLLEAVKIMEHFAQHVPEFDADAAGFGQVSHDLNVARATLELDLSSKPNLQYSGSHETIRLERIKEVAEVLDRVRAHVVLRTYDIELSSEPPQEAAQ